ncbi:MAG: hypothetical protein P8129_24380 [Anaerolineae bacterium]|jgi:hypothetical protein
MTATTGSALLVMLLGIASTTQTHLAKALERQGIETWDLIRAKLRRDEHQVEGSAHKPAIYIIGLVLNNTTFLYHLLVAPLGGTTALYTSMFGMGLIALLLWSRLVLKEKLGRLELAGALAILAGTLITGLDGVARPQADMGRMDLGHTAAAGVLLLLTCLVLMVAGLRSGRPDPIGLSFGLAAGAAGALDPFFKAVGQTAGGGALAPGSAGGWVLMAVSFPIGAAAMLITQWGFYRRARANILVPAYNCGYVAVPVILQALLLPGYALYPATLLGLVLIAAGFICLRGFRPGAAGAGSPAP